MKRISRPTPVHAVRDLETLDEAVRAAREAGCKDLVLLKCTSTYPATPENTNLMTIPHLRALFGCEVGLSDHTMGVGAAVAAVALGATVVEKHFTLSRADGGVDSTFSLEPYELAALVVETERAWQALGSVRYGASEAEKKSLAFRRSLYVAQDMKAGQVFDEVNLRAVRPGFGLPPKHYDSILGRKVRVDCKRGTPLNWDLLA
jgi:N-acetylneuraminate synthase